MGVLALLISKFMLLAAASALSNFGAADTKSLRAHGLIYLWALMFSAPFMMAPVTAVAGSVASGTYSLTHNLSVMYGWSLVTLVLIIPFLTCYGRDQERKFWPDGTFRIQNTFVGTPSGGLPYLLLIILGGAASIALGVRIRTGVWPDGELAAIAFWASCLWFFGWSLGRWTSNGNAGLRVARTMHFAILLAIGGLPVPFFTLLNPNFEPHEGSVWDFYVMRPVLGGIDNTTSAVITGIALLLLGMLITLFAERGAAVHGVRLRTNE
jgi:hypothetical protein